MFALATALIISCQMPSGEEQAPIMEWPDAYSMGMHTGTPLVVFNRCRVLPMRPGVIMSAPYQSGPQWRRGVLVARWMSGRWYTVWLEPTANQSQIRSAIGSLQTKEPPLAK